MNRAQKASISLGTLLLTGLIFLVLLSLQQNPAAVPVSPSPTPVQTAAPLPPEDTLELFFFDVGQGDSTLVRFPLEDGSVWNMLIDTGEYAFADGLTEALRALGTQRIDVLVNTHPHSDHMGSMARVIGEFEIGTFFMPVIPPEQVPTTAAYEATLRRLEEKEIAAIPLREGTAIPCPDQRLGISVLAPDPYAVWSGLNNYSGVIRLTWGERSFLLTGDAEKESEQVLLYSDQELSADLLKCGHHGSGSSTSLGFLEAVNPHIAVISCGRDNPYGHPHQQVLDALDSHSVKVYRTDQDRTIRVRCDGKEIQVETGLSSIAGKGSDN